MPNYCDNYIQLEGDVDVIRKLVKDNTIKYSSWMTNDVEVDSFDLTMMRPTPRVLDQITSGSMQHEGVTLSNWAYRNAEGEFVGKDLENRNDDSLTIVPISIKEVNTQTIQKFLLKKVRRFLLNMVLGIGISGG